MRLARTAETVFTPGQAVVVAAGLLLYLALQTAVMAEVIRERPLLLGVLVLVGQALQRLRILLGPVAREAPQARQARASTVVPALSAPGVVEAEVRSVRRPLDRVVMVVLAFAS